MAAALISASAQHETEMEIAEAMDCAGAPQPARRMAEHLGFSAEAVEEVALAVAELATNVVKHAGRGVLTLRSLHREGSSGIEIQAEDRGPGIADIERSFEDGYSTKGSLGYGLGTVNRLMDEVEISSVPGCGTRVICRRWTHPAAGLGAKPWDVGVATRSRRMAPENGDAFVVKTGENGLLVGLIDGLGHGEHAQNAAVAAQWYVERHNDQELGKIFLGVSRVCRGTRGVVMALVRFRSEQEMTFASLGNVEARVYGSPERVPFIVRRGILGTGDIPPVVQELAWNRDWMLVLHTDGLRTHWQWEDFPGLAFEPAKVIVSKLMHHLAADVDDATVLVVKGQGA
jgi:anti-sigma regulatory factor (Ser/Thr protein kinase)